MTDYDDYPTSGIVSLPSLELLKGAFIKGDKMTEEKDMDKYDSWEHQKRDVLKNYDFWDKVFLSTLSVFIGAASNDPMRGTMNSHIYNALYYADTICDKLGLDCRPLKEQL